MIKTTGGHHYTHECRWNSATYNNFLYFSFGLQSFDNLNGHNTSSIVQQSTPLNLFLFRTGASREKKGKIVFLLNWLTYQERLGRLGKMLVIETKDWDLMCVKTPRNWILTVVARTECGQHPTRKLLHTLLSLNFIANSGSPKIKISKCWFGYLLLL